jgi:hypothetical protein
MSQYISLGCDCSVSYQLRKLGLQTEGTMPFDWMKITNIEKLVAILDKDFTDFVDFINYDVKLQNAMFDYVDTTIQNNIKSLNKLIHLEYNFVLPHEYVENYIDIQEFEAKYSRRIERFRSVVRNVDIRKVFVRLGNTKEKKKQSILEDALARYGCKNFVLRYVNIDDYAELIPGTITNDVFDWHRDYMPWIDILAI